MRVGAVVVGANNDENGERRRKGKGIDIYPTCGHLELFSRGCAYERTCELV